MKLNKIFKNAFLLVAACLVLSACATKKVSTQMQGDVYTGTDTVEYLASGVPDRVFLQRMSLYLLLQREKHLENKLRG